MNTIAEGGGNVTKYNFRKFDGYDFSSMNEFMNYEDTVKRYHVDPSVAGTF
eukprot:CAMPEP_0114580352 /NCGR_PEP_ID=MMETSP0125-20121206/4665_1 /TAXON_ID=485358 ORGANISM="Aristerostoma sp., Strain ATCC 50986" /NCGR_SAMPLE_ID=MMETSP0125 /ASSEMBLY_ACC=CAM_ASM_000245 /LENGTH=50 /DNA_ID=CAMNT_0001771883 /DNA_START=696 /DNA_END=848 /DNA_ORIENTATION=-